MLKKRSLAELDGQSKLKLLAEAKEGEGGDEGHNGGLHYFQHSKSPNGIATSFENALVSIKMLRIECRYDVFHDRIHVTTNFNDEATSENYEGFDQIALMSREDRPRRNIFGGTTNDNKYLRDTTGNRRIWSVDLCGKGLIDLEGIARDRDQSKLLRLKRVARR